MALSGGRVAGRLFESIARLGSGRPALLRPVHFLFADERCVPPEDPESNYGLARAHLFHPLDLLPEQIHRIHGEHDPQMAANLAAADLAHLTQRTPHGIPVLDLVFLGMGEDGHIASIFPGTPSAVLDGPALYHPVTGPKPPLHRITITMPVLAQAREVWVLISGPGKESVLHRTLHAHAATPLGHLLHQRTMTRLFTASGA